MWPISVQIVISFHLGHFWHVSELERKCEPQAGLEPAIPDSLINLINFD